MGILVLQFIITAFCYLAVPFCVWLLCWGFGKQPSKSAIRNIVILNGVVMWVILKVIMIEQGIESNSAAVFLWSGVAYWMLKNKAKP